ncbi:hypothetical protein D4100_22870 [Serratia inhibens]|uniref:Uncharacterized protein n=1 Tax=Serratia inhibens TaxID=2338073 RepID=A0AA92X102_9GAMM|nr:hypothetical protein [Serratia inhibens]RJF53323.1 hypothetical protein D4100_22870 [Serratia inhibens]
MAIENEQFAIILSTLSNGQLDITVSGESYNLITDSEKKLFGIEESTLKELIKKDFYDAEKNVVTPDNIFYKDDGDFNNFSTYEWTPTYVRIAPAGVTWEFEPDRSDMALATSTQVNNSSEASIFTCALSKQETLTAEMTWSTNDSISVGQSINYNLGVPGAEIGGETTFQYTHEWGTSTTEAIEKTIGLTQTVQTELQPHQAVDVTLSAIPNTLTITIPYTAELVGYINPCFPDPVGQINAESRHYFWRLDPTAYAKESMIVGTLTIELNYYTQGRLVVTDHKKDVIAEKQLYLKTLAVPGVGFAINSIDRA